MAIITFPLCCPSCGERDRLVLITPLQPGPDGWGRRCKTCGRRWSLDDEPDPADSRQRAETAVGLARALAPHIRAGATRAEALDAAFAAIFGDAIRCSRCGVGYTDDEWTRRYPDGENMPELAAFVCGRCARQDASSEPLRYEPGWVPHMAPEGPDPDEDD